MKLKGEMSMLNVLHLQEVEVDAVCAELQAKRDEAPQFFMQSPIVIDCDKLDEKVAELDFISLKKGLLDLGFIPIGIRNIPENMHATLANDGWAVMRENRGRISANDESKEQQSIESANNDTSNEETVDAQEPAQISLKSLTVERPVRSGQQVYATEADMTVLAPTSAGSEIMADGSIHVYGALRGRVLAGARGNKSARIFCQSLQAELIAIAGRYQLLDESDTDLRGKAAMIRLEGEKLIIEPLV